MSCAVAYSRSVPAAAAALLNPFAWPTREKSPGARCDRTGTGEHHQAEIAQQQGSHIKITDGAHSPALLLSVYPRQQFGEHPIHHIERVILFAVLQRAGQRHQCGPPALSGHGSGQRCVGWQAIATPETASRGNARQRPGGPLTLITLGAFRRLLTVSMVKLCR
jgi:hypothetical protein